MSRGVGATDFLHDLLAPAEALVLVLTQLGDGWFLLAIAGAALWLGPAIPILDLDRHQALLLLSGILLAAAATGLLKAWTDLPRPALAPTAEVAAARDTLVAAAGADGPGFPSGHAAFATVGYGGLAHLSKWGTPRRRWSVAAGLVTIVCLTRLALGVHYLVDVAVGVVLGLALLGFLVSLAGRPEIVLALALSTSVAWLSVDVSTDALSVAGAVAGVLVGWSAFGRAIHERRTTRPRIETRTVAAGGLLLAGLALVWLTRDWELATLLGAALAGLGAVAVPGWVAEGSSDGGAAEG